VLPVELIVRESAGPPAASIAPAVPHRTGPVPPRSPALPEDGEVP
jgi:hypothetical protein